MAGYRLTINNDKSEITLSTEMNPKTIEKVIFRMNTLDDKTVNRADLVRCEFEIEGRIDKDNKEKTKELALWSKDANQNTLYRNVKIVVYNSDNLTGKALRKYVCESMFVVDYIEEFGEKADEGKYKLILAQKEGRHTKDVFSE